MLQQTQVSTVVEYFHRWTKRFPDIHSLALAEEQEVLEVWAGLGYYSRARNLLATAQRIVNEYDGQVPSLKSELMSLKGIGEYTAGAIASLAFNLPEPILDGNLVRVFSRVYGLSFLPVSKAEKSSYWDYSRAWVSSHEPALVNEGLMELGATVCTPKQPTCAVCPISKKCQAYKNGSQDRFPPAKDHRDVAEINGYVVVAIRKRNKPDNAEALLYRPQKPELLANLMTFPVFTVSDIPSLKSAWKTQFPDLDVDDFRLQSKKINHAITHHKIKLEILEVNIVSMRNKSPLPKGFLWGRVADLEKILVSSLPRKIWDKCR